MKSIRDLRASALAELGRGAPMPSEVLELRASPGGAKLTEAEREQLLTDAVARKKVSLVIELRAYEQGRRDKDGKVVKNRKGVRVRSGAMMAFGRSAPRAPYLRDHQQWDSRAKGGVILDSRAVKLTEDGHYEVLATVQLLEPAAVERALRGLMDAVSVGIEALGPVHCTACRTEVLTRCFHFPFDVVAKDDGTEIECEWEYQEAGIIEISEVPIGAVHRAGLTEIRAALSAALAAGHPGFRADSAHGDLPEENDMDPKLLKLLGLAATAGVTEVHQSVEALITDRAELAIITRELAVANAELSTLRGEKTKSEADKFIGEALASGRITKGDEKAWRDLFELSADRARKRMSERPEGFATPVGLPRQSANDPGAGPAAPGTPPAASSSSSGGGTGEAITPELKTTLASAGVDADIAVAMARKFGAKTPVATMTEALGLKKGA